MKFSILRFSIIGSEGAICMAKQLVEFTKLDTKKILINPNLIETVEATPDTVIILNTGRKLLVKESISEILDKISD